MKTFDEDAKEYGEYVSPHSMWTAKNAEISFKAGVKFITQWYTFEDEIPEHNVKVETKDIHGEIITFKFTGASNIKESAKYMSFTHWRPIY